MQNAGLTLFRSMGDTVCLAMSACSGIANLHNTLAMTRRRKRILFAVLLLVFSLGLAWFLRPRNEPQYQGRYLSQWADLLTRPAPTEDDKLAVWRALEQIGTNGLPLYVAWMSVETPPWKRSLRQKLPGKLAKNKTIANWLGEKDRVRAALGMHGIELCGTNAASAIPALNSLMITRTNTLEQQFAIDALTGIGGQSIPVLKAAFADQHHPFRTTILMSMHRLSLSGYTNECMPIITAALADRNPSVREMATNLLQGTFTNHLRGVGPH
jgi:hypothetical protein